MGYKSPVVILSSGIEQLISIQMRSCLLIFLIFLAFLPAKAQDLHFSQFYHNPLQFNAASTGIFNGDWRVAGLYRSQWSSVPVDYSTFAVAFDRKILQRGATQVSGGLLLERDQAGDAGLRWTQVGLSGSVARQLSAEQVIVVGAGLAFVQRSFNVEKLKFKNQWTGDVFDQQLPSGETFSPSSAMAPTLSASLLWHYRPGSSRSWLDIGLGAAHLNGPSVSFRDDIKTKLPMRLNALLHGAWQINERFDLVGFALAQQMTKAQEIVLGAGVRRILTDVPGNLTAVQFSLATRLKDAFIPAVQLEKNNWTIGFSYDWNMSDFQVASQHRGGLEIAVVYRHVPVPPLVGSKSCPIF